MNKIISFFTHQNTTEVFIHAFPFKDHHSRLPDLVMKPFLSSKDVDTYISPPHLIDDSFIRNLDLSSNNMTYLPRSVSLLSRLAVLDLSFNYMLSDMSSLQDASTLVVLHLRGLDGMVSYVAYPDGYDLYIGHIPVTNTWLVLEYVEISAGYFERVKDTRFTYHPYAR